MPRYRLGVDIGGTFTDFCLLDEETGKVSVLKVPSRADAPEEAIFDGLRQLREQHAVDPGDIGYFIHGTTLAVNTVIQRSGAKTALLLTEGFKDVMNIARHRIPDVFNFFTELPKSLVPRSRAFEIPERIAPSGDVVIALDEGAVREAAAAIRQEGIEAVAVCFLHSYREAAHEMRARTVLEQQLGDSVYISLSSEIWPQLREYERALIAVINAYVGRKMRIYFTNLEQGLSARGVRAQVLSTKSNGGVMHAREAGERPVEALMAGPAAGVMGAARLARTAGITQLLAFDMGGTSADVAVIDGDAQYSTENQVGDFPIIMPAIDVSSIGAGGGSIAWTDANGVLKVGPVSAGADPGPACYGKGGTRPTVTDAFVCLGIIGADRTLAGNVRIQPGLAEASLQPIAAALNTDVATAAEGVLRVATAQMYATLVPLMARKGVDYEDFVLLCFGGAGPTHGFLMAREVGIRRVIIPPHPGILCALGALAADLKRDFVRTVHAKLAFPVGAGLMAALRGRFDELVAEARGWLAAQAVEVSDERIELMADMRYLGQSFELTVPIEPADLEDDTGLALKAAFEAAYDRTYGYTDPAAAMEILDVRVRAIGMTPKPEFADAATGAIARTDAVPRRTRSILFEGRRHDAAVYQRAELSPGMQFAGPAIVEQYDTTTWMPPGFSAHIDAYGNIVGVAA